MGEKIPVKFLTARVAYIEGADFLTMPRNQITRDEMRVRVLNLKNRVDNEPTPYKKEKELAHKYLNEVLFIIDQYAR